MSRYRPYDPTNIQSFINDHAQHNTAASVANWGSIFEEYLKSVDVTITSLTDQELLNHVTNFYFQLVKKDGKPYKASSIRTSIGALGSYLRNAKPSFILNSYVADTGGELFKVLDGVCKDLARSGSDEIQSSTPLSVDQEEQIHRYYSEDNRSDLVAIVGLHIAKFGALRGGKKTKFGYFLLFYL